jgi:DNA recombination protein RmuC
MDAWRVVLGIVAAAAGAAAVWLALAWVRARAEHRAAAEHAGRAEELAREERARAEDLAERLAQRDRRIVELEEEAGAAAQMHRAEQGHQRELLAGQVRAVEDRERQLRLELAQAREQMRDVFRSLSADALKESTAQFLALAQQRLSAQQKDGEAAIEQRRAAVDGLIRPLAETLGKTDAKLAAIEKAWAEDKGRLSEELRRVGETGEALRAETGKLVRALREPQVRGRYGEIQLRRVAELAGMRAYCDFAEQEQTTDADGNALRPDMIVRLPGGREVVVDAKANLKPYLDALEAPDPEQAERHLHAFADGVAKQATLLARKGYWRQYLGSPEFVVMFVPGDQFVDAALSKRPDLLEMAASQRVMLASPSTLIGLLRAVHVGYQEQTLARQAQELRALGVELHQRAAAAMDHVADLGRSLERAVDAYNKFVGSYERRLEPTLRRFEEAGAHGAKPLPEVKPLVTRPRGVDSFEPTPLLPGADGATGA